MLDFDAIDTHLKQYALAAQGHPPKSVERQQALTALTRELQRPELLCRPFKGLFQGFYPEIYAEAKHMLFCYICTEIDRYNPEKEVLQWVNFLLRKRFFLEACREIYPYFKRGEKSTVFKSLDDLDSLDNLDSFIPDNPLLLSEQIIECLAEDPEGVFQQTYTRKPEANFQYIARKYVDGYEWREISDELGIGISSLSSFYYRSLKKFSPIFRKYLLSS